MQKVELIFDIGSKNIRVYKKDAGLIINEPSVAVIKHMNKSVQVVCVGNNALKKISRLDSDEQEVYPVREGRIANEKYAVLLFRHFIKTAAPKTGLFKPNVSVMACISCGLNAVERKNIEDVFSSAGANDVILIESPVAAGQLTGLKNYCIVDIGGVKSEIALVTPNGILSGCSINIGGDNINFAIMDYVGSRYNTSIQPFTTEKLKKSLASLYSDDNSSASVSGKGRADDEPKAITIYSSELKNAITSVLDQIAEVVESVLMMAPETMAMEIFKTGIFLCGGTALMPGIAEYFAEKLMTTIHVLDAPESASVNGCAKFLYNKDSLSEALNLQAIE